LPWTDGNGPTPERSERELLALVKARAGTIRRRRRVSVSAAATSSVAVLILAVTTLVGRSADSGHPTALRVTGPATSVTSEEGGGGVASADLPEPATTSTTGVTAAAASSMPPPPPTVRTTLPPATGGTGTTAAVRSAPVTTVPPSTSTTSTTVAPLPVCSPSDVLVTVTTDKASYAAAETVRFELAAANGSGHACAPADFRAEVRDPNGTSIAGMAEVDRFTLPLPGQPPMRWEPGQTLTTSFGWTPACPPTNSPASCPPGTYTVTASFGSFRSAPTGFKVT
jgi:cytoskeletal protein RodZ